MIETQTEHEARVMADVAETRAAVPTLPDGSLDVAAATRAGVFDDALDLLHSTQGNASGGSAERERVERWEASFLHALKAEVTVRLMGDPHRLRALHAEYQLEHDAYVVELADMERNQRRYFVRLYLPEVDALARDAAARGSCDAGRAMIDMCCERAIEAKAHYMARMK